MNLFVSYSLLLVLYILYLYDVHFRLLPYSMEYIVGNLGFIVSIKHIISDKYKFRRELIWYLAFPIIIIAWDLLICVINENYEYVLSKNVIGAIRALFGAHFLYLLSKNHIKNIQDFHRLIVLVVLIESILCVGIKVSPTIYSFIDSIQQFDTGNANVYDLENYKRFVGIGNAVFFGVLRTCTIGLISAVCLINYSKTAFNKLFYVFAFIVISVISFLVARTVLLLFTISLLLLIIYQRHLSFTSKFYILFLFILFVFICYELIILLLPENVLIWGFSSLDRSETSGDSIDTVKEWLFNTKFNLKTFLLGDAHYVGRNGGYYMNVDIGLYRRIYYAGFIGLILSLYYHYMTLKMVCKYDKSYDCKLMCYALFVCYLIILCKGDTSFMRYFVLYLVFYSNGVLYLSPNNNRIRNSLSI